MSYSPPPFNLYWKELKYLRQELISVPDGTFFANPIELAKWQLTPNPGSVDKLSYVRIPTWGLELGNIGTVGQVVFSLDESDDGVVWTAVTDLAEGSGGFNDNSLSQNNQTLNASTRFLRYSLYNTAAGVIGQAQNIMANGWYSPPFPWTFARIL